MAGPNATTYTNTNVQTPSTNAAVSASLAVREWLPTTERCVAFMLQYYSIDICLCLCLCLYLCHCLCSAFDLFCGSFRSTLCFRVLY